MNELRSTLIEENFPVIRRRKSNATLQGIFRNGVAEAFLTLVEGDKHVNSKQSLADSQEAISYHFRRINSIIDSVDEHITRRLENHENQVFSLVKGEIEEMRAQTKRIVDQLNQAIAQKNTEDEIWKLSNQLDYFKTQTFQLYNDHKKAREEVVALRAAIRELNIQLENNDLVMQRLKKKYMRENFIKDRLATLIKEKIKAHRAQEITIQQIEDILRLQKPNTQPRPRFKTESNQTNGKFFQSKVNVHINNNSVHQQAKFSLNEEDKNSEKISLLNSYNDGLGNYDLPPVQLIKVESLFTDEVAEKSQIINHFQKKIEIGIQTESIRASESSKPEAPVKPFSNTSYIDFARDQPNKKLDLSKSGFFVRSYNSKSGHIQDKEESSRHLSRKKEPSHKRYMSKAFNKSKMVTWKGEVRGSTNKSSLK